MQIDHEAVAERRGLDGDGALRVGFATDRQRARRRLRLEARVDLARRRQLAVAEVGDGEVGRRLQRLDQRGLDARACRAEAAVAWRQDGDARAVRRQGRSHMREQQQRRQRALHGHVALAQSIAVCLGTP